MKKNLAQSTYLSMLILLIVTFVSENLAAQQFSPDHYLTYDIKATPFIRRTVTLEDQFIEPTDFRVRRPNKLFNPTVKRHNNKVFPISNEKLHYTAYDVEPAQPVQVDATVRVFNQFGSFVFDRFEPTRLLVPTAKRVVGRSTELTDEDEAEVVNNADHYLCYDIEPITVTTQGGFLKDQFRSRDFTTLIATRLCNPVAKEHNGKRFEIINNDSTNHLMCFQLDRKRIFRLVTLADQFGRRGAAVYRDDEICVPSEKLKIPEECEGSLPDDDGICNGTCSDPAAQCLPTAAGPCRCQTEPQLCEETIPGADGTCNGLCPENQICRPDASGEKCACVDDITPCGITPEGLCGGVCPNPNDLCVTDIGTQQCMCLSVAPTCGATAPDGNGECNGLCPPDLICLPDSSLQTCECRELVRECGLDANGECGGACENANEICAFVAGTNECRCQIPEPVNCADTIPDPNGLCGGLCPADEICVSTDTACECRPQMIPCGFTPDGECGGECPAGEQCSFVPGTELCACIA